MDWGLIRSKDPKTYALRDKLLYPKWFYYYAIISNFIMRFFWLLNLPSTGYGPPWVKNHAITFIMMFVEGFRRAQWSLIRIENEHVNNPE